MNTNAINKQFITNSQLIPWYMAQFRKQFVAWITLPLEFQAEYWNTIAAVIEPPVKKVDNL